MLEDILLKVADNKPLTSNERDTLRQDIRGLVVLGNQFKERRLDKPIITDPDFRSSPLKVFHCYIPDSSPVEIANNTLTAVTFVSGSGDVSVFDFYQNNKSKIRMDRSQLNIRLDGVLDWETDADGQRSVFISVYDIADVQVGVKEISCVKPVDTAATRMNFSYTEDIRSIFPNGVYFKMFVFHTAGAGLDLLSFVMSVSIA